MDSPGSDDERPMQANEPSFSKRMKILVIMLSLVLMILLFPLASDHGVTLLRPMGVSMLQRLWDAMRFIAMTAAISVGIISTSSGSHRSNRRSDASHGSSSSSRSPTTPPRSSREASSPKFTTSMYMTGSDPFTQKYHDIVADVDKNDAYEWRNHTQLGAHNVKGKNVAIDMSSPDLVNVESSCDGDRDNQCSKDTSPSVDQEMQSIEADNSEYGYEKPLKLSMVSSSRRHMSAGDAWLLAALNDEEIARLRIRDPGFERKETFIEGESEVRSKEIPGPTKGLTSGSNGMADDSYGDVMTRRSAISQFVDKYHSEKEKNRPRSSSVGRRPIIYDQQSSDQPGLKQILMDMSKERRSRLKKSDLGTTHREINKRMSGRSTNSQLRRVSETNSVISSTLVDELPDGNAQHRQAPIISPVRVPSVTIMHHVNGKDTATYENQSESARPHHKRISRGEADTEKRKPTGMNQGMQKNRMQVGFTAEHPTSKEIRQNLSDFSLGMEKQAHTNLTKMSSIQGKHKHIDRGKANTENQDHKETSKSQLGSDQGLHKQSNLNLGHRHQRPEPKDADDLLQMQNNGKLGRERTSLQWDSISKGTSFKNKTLKRRSRHSQSTVNLEQLELQASENTQEGEPVVGALSRGRRSFSYDFGDGFTADWLMALEPPPPPGLLSEHNTMSLEAEKSDTNDSAIRQPKATTFPVESLLPWRTTTPIAITTYPSRAASPPISTGPSPGELNRKADEFISNFHLRLMKQKQESLERRSKYVTRDY
ncbi:hypothetical protein KP509_06G027100 [Ceratopteris richardii]|uniref:Uncharacterized protein n=1 Tax=Ceratopteris richardii TaxID=49495 RepID=A0A8T2UM95_CERRI|nr:hypothetical protein KP509_06G027100 [Ceratopteris richardii]KAH7434635.1 hypothetical protein KP509_06G027100 [Ceratopteris richardii]